MGRWSFGHQLWTEYQEIGKDLRHRTRQIQFKRGLGKDPDEEDLDGFKFNFAVEDDVGGDEEDTLDLNYIGRRAGVNVRKRYFCLTQLLDLN